jgi:hypothetical protein
MSANRPASLGAAAAVRPLHEPPELPWRTLTIISVLLVIVGVLAFIAGLHEGAQSRVWEAYLVNLLFFIGIAQGAIVLAATCYLTQGRWGGLALYRLAEAFFWFLPLGFILFWALYCGRDYLFPWVLHPIPGRTDWLNAPFLFARDGIALFVITAFSAWFVHSSRRADVQKWVVSTETIDLPPPIMRRISPTIPICFVLVYSLLGFDLVMSLSPLWRDSLFGAYFFVSVFWSSLTAVALTVVIFRCALGPANRFSDRSVVHDFGKLVFAFMVFWLYIFFSQFIIIWYANLPSETFFLALRVNYLPWATWSWAAMAMVGAIPFLVLLGARPKRTPVILGLVSLIGMIGIWVLFYDLVVPSLSPRTVPYGWLELFITAGFVGAFALCSIPGLKLFAQAMVGGQIGEER